MGMVDGPVDSQTVLTRKTCQLGVFGKRPHARMHVENGGKVRIALIPDGLRDTIGDGGHATRHTPLHRRTDGSAMRVAQNQQKLDMKMLACVHGARELALDPPRFPPREW